MPEHQSSAIVQTKYQHQQLEDVASDSSCINCNHVNEDGAVFCEECGNKLSYALACRKCGHVSEQGTDICNKCGEWLKLEGLCRFCYAPIDPYDAFCQDCGKPSKGILCPACNNLSYSDFCTHCLAALTDDAVTAVEMMKDDVAFQTELIRIEQMLEDLSYNPVLEPPEESLGVITSDSDELARLKEYKNNICSPKTLMKEATSTKVSGIFSDSHKSSIDKLNAEVISEEIRLEEIRRLEEEKRRIEEERKRIEEERKRLEEERKRKAEERRRAESKGNVIFSNIKDVKITVCDENCALDDAYMLYVNGETIGIVDHKQGGFTTYGATLNDGENTIKLALHRLNGCGSWFTVSVMPGGRKLGVGGSNDHYIKVVID